MRRTLLLMGSILSSMLTACSGTDDAGDPSNTGGSAMTTGGNTSTGGSTSTGGAATGGSPGSGATSGGDGGGTATGGAGSGGAPASGGAASGGATASGGTAAGGMPASGGAASGGGGAPNEGPPNDDVPDTAACADFADWDDTWRERETRIVELVNVERLAGTDCSEAKNPVGALVMDPVLRCAARLHAADMAERGFFSHGTWDPEAPECTTQSQCGRTQTCDNQIENTTPSRCLEGPSARLDAVDYRGNTWGENIAAGNSAASGTMGQWMSSPGHCNNILSGSYTKIGVGYAPGGRYGHVWVQVFGN